MKMMKRNAYRALSNATIGCTIEINRWLVGRAAAICKACGVVFKVDDSSINYEDDSMTCVVAAEDELSYAEAGMDLHNVLGIDISPSFDPA